MKAPKQYKSIDSYIFVCIILSLLCISSMGAALALISAFTVIGLPLTLVIIFLPSLTLLLFFARVFHYFLENRNLKSNWLICIVAAAAILAIPPLLINLYFKNEAASLIAGDFNEMDPKISYSTLAVLYPTGYHRSGVCDDLCRMALLDGRVQKVIMARAKAPLKDIDLGLEGHAYWFEEREICPKIDLKSGGNNLELKRRGKNGVRKSLSDLIRLRAATGNCFVSEKAKIADADALLVSGTIKSGARGASIGLSLFVNTTRASRLSFDLIENGKLQRKYQSTGVSIKELFPILMPGLFESHGLEFSAGFLRKSAYLGEAKKYHLAPSLTNFVQDVLGFDLEILHESAERDTLKIVRAALGKSGNLSQSEIDVISDFFNNVRSRGKLSSEKVSLMLDALKDHRIPVPENTSRAIRAFPEGNAETTKLLATTLFERLRDFKPDVTIEYFDHQFNSLKGISRAISALPDEKILPYFAELENLARNPVDRIFAYNLIKKMSVFKAKSIPVFLYLMDDSQNYRNTKPKKIKPHRNAWQHTYLAGTEGLCRLSISGFKDETIIAKLYERLDSGELNIRGSYGKRSFATMVNFGADPEEIWRHLKLMKSNFYKISREKFDRMTTRSNQFVKCS